MLFPLLLDGQSFIHENAAFECDQAFEIKLSQEVSRKATVFYQYEEQFSFWYKLEAEHNQYLQLEVQSLDSNDQYAVVLFEYLGDSFCQDVFQEKIKPEKLRKEKSTAFSTQFQLTSQAGKTYYLCVLSVSASNCGHLLKYSAGEITSQVKAIHIPCEVPEEIEQEKKSTELSQLSNSLKAFLSLVDQDNPKQAIRAEISIEDPLTGQVLKIDFDSSRKQAVRIDKGKGYRVQVLAPGYKRFEHELILSEYLEKDSSQLPIYLKRLDRGDKFVMNHIYFHPNTYALKKEAKQELSYLLNFLENNPSLKIELAGHTNGNHKIRRNRAYKKRGAAWNFKGSSKKLSIYRAEEIKKRLVKEGIAADRIETVGYGGDYMLIPDARTLEAIEKNVRVEVRLF